MPKPRILVTRSPHQASTLADLLRVRGFEPILIPTIELTTPSSFAPLDVALATLANFHWLLFTSANAVEAFRVRFLAQLPPDLRIAAIGPATAAALQPLGTECDLVPPQAVAESFAEALLPFATQPDGTPTRFLLVRAEAARDQLPDALRAAGAEVTIAPAYRTVVPQAAIAQLQALFASPETCPDAITFTSSSTVQNLLTLLDSAGLTLPRSILRASIGPITSETLRALGHPPQVEAAEPAIAALVEILVKVFSLN